MRVERQEPCRLTVATETSDSSDRSPTQGSDWGEVPEVDTPRDGPYNRAVLGARFCGFRFCQNLINIIPPSGGPAGSTASRGLQKLRAGRPRGCAPRSPRSSRPQPSEAPRTFPRLWVSPSRPVQAQGGHSASSQSARPAPLLRASRSGLLSSHSGTEQRRCCSSQRRAAWPPAAPFPTGPGLHEGAPPSPPLPPPLAALSSPSPLSCPSLPTPSCPPTRVAPPAGHMQLQPDSPCSRGAGAWSPQEGSPGLKGRMVWNTQGCPSVTRP